MLINRASGDAGRLAVKLIGAHFVAPLAAKQRSKFIISNMNCTARTMRSIAANFKKLQAILRHTQRATLIAWERKVLLTRAAVK